MKFRGRKRRDGCFEVSDEIAGLHVDLGEAGAGESGFTIALLNLDFDDAVDVDVRQHDREHADGADVVRVRRVLLGDAAVIKQVRLTVIGDDAGLYSWTNLAGKGPGNLHILHAFDALHARDFGNDASGFVEQAGLIDLRGNRAIEDERGYAFAYGITCGRGENRTRITREKRERPGLSKTSGDCEQEQKNEFGDAQTCSRIAKCRLVGRKVAEMQKLKSAKGTDACRQTIVDLGRPLGGILETVLVLREFVERERMLRLILAGWLTAVGAANAQTLVRSSPEVDDLLVSPLQVEKVTTASGFKWTEGPVWIGAGYLLFAEIPGNSIWRWVPPIGSAPELFIRPSGFQGNAFGGPEPGSNGMTLDARSRLTIAGHARRNVWRLETIDPHGQITVLADEYQGKKLNSPNDVVYSRNGDLYFTDPPYGLATQSDKDPAKELPFNGVYRIRGATKQQPGAAPDHAALDLLVKDLTRPNGIAFSPDEKTLYVDNSEPKKVWMRYHVKADGTLENGRLLYDATSDQSPGAPDGMKVDRQGNIYSAGPGGVWIFSPSGKHLGTIKMPDRTSNVAWGEADGKTLYITCSANVYRVRTKVGGVLP